MQIILSRDLLFDGDRTQLEKKLRGKKEFCERTLGLAEWLQGPSWAWGPIGTRAFNFSTYYFNSSAIKGLLLFLFCLFTDVQAVCL